LEVSELVDILLFILGLLGLYLGAEGLVSGSSKLAVSLGIRPVVVGLTIISFGISAPEGVVSILAVEYPIMIGISLLIMPFLEEAFSQG
jgi:Ca2+/Na+ antiporter